MMPRLKGRQLANAPLRAGYLLIGGQVEAARALCEQALVEAPLDWPERIKALQMLARIARRQQDWPRALEVLTEVLRLVPDEAAEWYQRGLVYRSLAQWDAALADMEQAVTLSSDPAEHAHFAQGLAVTRREAQAAQQAAQRARTKPPRMR
jgi:regulator of sirC expression with transglutaminase-like and TPR domain